MEKVSIKMYAVKHKLSIFNVIKMVKSGKLKTVIDEENGKEMTYILLDDEIEKEIQNSIVPVDEAENSTVKNEIKQLKVELLRLRDEVELLKKAIL